MKRKDKIDTFLYSINTYYSIPFLVVFAFAWISQFVKSQILIIIINIVLTTFTIIYLYKTISAICKKIIKKEKIWIVVLCLTFIVLSYILIYTSNVVLSNILFISGTILFECYSLYEILQSCLSEKSSIGKILIFGLLFVVIGYLIIFLSSYNMDDKTLFNSLIAVFSAIIGGGLTLAGVAWEIRNSRNEKKKEEQERAKPLFTYNMIFDEPDIKGLKICCPDDPESEYRCDVYFEIENSNHSSFVLKRIFHDKKCFNLKGNTVVLPDKKVLVSFKFENPNDICLEIEDSLGNKYYYDVLVLNTNLLNNKKDSKSILMHTIRELNENKSGKIV